MFKFNSNPSRKRTPLPTDPNNKEQTSNAPQRATAPNLAASQGMPEGNQPKPLNQGTNPAVEQRIDEIERQRIAFAKLNPDFDMRAEMENPQFVNYIWGNGLSVEDAFFLVHRDELLEEAANEAVAELQNRQNRISENGAAKIRPAMAKKNPKDLSDKEIDAIIERVRNGEKISF